MNRAENRDFAVAETWLRRHRNASEWLGNAGNRQFRLHPSSFILPLLAGPAYNWPEVVTPAWFGATGWNSVVFLEDLGVRFDRRRRRHGRRGDHYP